MPDYPALIDLIANLSYFDNDPNRRATLRIAGLYDLYSPRIDFSGPSLTFAAHLVGILKETPDLGTLARYLYDFVLEGRPDLRAIVRPLLPAAEPDTPTYPLIWGYENTNDGSTPDLPDLTDAVIAALLTQFHDGVVNIEWPITDGFSTSRVLLVRVGEFSAFAKIGPQRSVEREWRIARQVKRSHIGEYAPRTLCDPLGPVQGYSAVLYQPAQGGVLNALSLANYLKAPRHRPLAAAAQVEAVLTHVIRRWHDEYSRYAGHPTPPTHPAALLREMLDVGEERRAATLADRAREVHLPGKYSPLIQFRPGVETLLPNPIAYALDDALWEDRQIRPFRAPIHGDFHCGNIVCRLNRDNYPDSAHAPWLIDFAQSASFGVATLDLAYLEIDLINRQIVAAPGEGWEDWRELAEFLASDFLPNEMRLSGGRPLAVWTLIKPIRQFVNHWHEHLSGHNPDAAIRLEHSWWLAATGAGLLFARRSKASPCARQAALLYAACALNQLLKKLPLSKPDRKAIDLLCGTEAPVISPDQIAAYAETLFAEKTAELEDQIRLTAKLRGETEGYAIDLSGEQQQSVRRVSRGMDSGWDELTPMGADYWPAERDMHEGAESVKNIRERLLKAPKAVLIGEPGAGKTVTLRQLALDHLRAFQQDPARPLPVFVPLAKFSGQGDFRTFAFGFLGNLRDAVEAGLIRVVWLLDALNEMPNRDAAKPGLLRFLNGLGGEGRFTLTCRRADYREDLSSVDGVEKFELHDLSPVQIQQIIERTFADEPERAEALWADLRGNKDLTDAWPFYEGEEKAFWAEAKGDAPSPVKRRYVERSTLSAEKKAELLKELRSWNMPAPYTAHITARRALHTDPRKLMLMCRTPLVLSMVTHMAGESQNLPNNRAALFGKFATQLLERQRRLAIRLGSPWPDGTVDRIKAALEQVAAAIQATEQRTELKAEAAIAAIGGPDARDLLLKAEAANLIQFGKTVRFTHQLLQEYYATAPLREAMDNGESPARFFGETWWEPGAWRETVVIFGEVLNDPQRVARWLAPVTPEVALDVVLRNGNGYTVADLTPDTRQTLIDASLKLGDLTPPSPFGEGGRGGEVPSERRKGEVLARAAAWRVIGALKADPRPGVLDFDIQWCDVPGGPFEMGGNGAYDGKPIHTVNVAAFQIAKYPVTYWQFQAFIDAPDGFNNPEWWHGLHEDGLKQQRGGPGDQAFKFWNHPRERVSWYDAVAFCRWLSRKLGYEVRLPTEAEWEKAARWDGQRSLEYPYGDTYDPTKSNTTDTKIRQTSAVGIFPDGAAPCRALDMSGNVFEWVSSKMDGYPYRADDGREDLAGNAPRRVRGGSWGYDQYGARAAYRSGGNPNYRDSSGLGFRVVVGGRPPSV